MSTLFHDLSFALRQLAKHRLYAITAILSMALGIGATAAVYSVLYGVLIDPYPYRDADRIAFVTVRDKQDRGIDVGFTLSELEQLQKTKSVEDTIAQRDVSMLTTDGDLPQSVRALEVTGNHFQFMGAPPMLGRTFTQEEAPRGSAPPGVAVISYPFWKTHFASRPDVVGSLLELNHQKYTVIGVVGPRYTWHDAEVYLPFPASLAPDTRLESPVRLRKGVSTATATDELDSYLRQFAHAHPEMLPSDGFHTKVETLNDWLLGQFKGTLLLLFIAVALLLLIGIGNVSILMLARGTARQQELATRAALGASRLRISRQLLTEAVLLSLSGGALGIVIAHLAIRLITALLPEYSIPHEVVIAVNTPVVLFSTAVSVATGIIAGVSPALHLSRPQISQIVQLGGTRSVTSRMGRTRSALIVGQVALTVLLLAASGAAMRNFVEAYTAQLGFDPHNMLMMFMALPEGSYTTWQARSNYYDAFIERVKSTPGVSAATLSTGGTPPRGNWTQAVDIVGAPPDLSRKTGVHLVSAEYFSVFRIPLLQGRTIRRAEVLRGAHLAVVSKTFVQKYVGDSDPIGRQILPVELSRPQSGALSAANPTQPYEIIGVVADVRNDGLHRPIVPQVYVPSTVVLPTDQVVLVRTAGDPNKLIHAISANVRTLDPNQAIARSRSFEEFLSTFVWSYERFISILFAIFSTIALALAAIGLFSVVAYTVEQRTREIGIRMALGARRWNVLRMMLASTARTAGIGLVLGIGLSIGLSDSIYRWTKSSTRDGAMLVIISIVFLVASAIACLLPARRAASIDPMQALRTE
jgi:predicted permease